MPVLIQPSSSPPAVRAIPRHPVARDEVQITNGNASSDVKAAGAGANAVGTNDAQSVNKAAVDSNFTLPAGGLTITKIQTVEPTLSTTAAPDAQSTVTVTEVVPPTSSTSVSSTESASPSETTSTTQTTSADPVTSTSTTSSTSTTTSVVSTSIISTETSATSTTIDVAMTSSTSAQATISSSTTDAEPQITSTVLVQDNSGQMVTSTIIVHSEGQVVPTSPAINAANSVPSAVQPMRAGAVQNNKVNPAVIVVPIILVLMLFVGLGVFFMRRHFLAKRQRKRNTWGAGIYPPQAPPPDFGPSDRSYQPARISNGVPSFMGENASVNMSAPMVQVMPPPQAPTGQDVYSAPMMPVATPVQAYNSPSLLAPSMSPFSAVGGGFGAGALVPAGSQSQATVKCSFVPSLPDELSIAAGEPIKLLAEYDDGWALCENARGEQGMVPLDCLDRGNGPTTPTSVTSFTARSQRRASSLAGAGIRG